MDWRVDLAALALGICGCLCAILTSCLALWEVSGTVGNTTATLPTYWDGVWLKWNHWDLNHDGRLHCSFYQALLSLSGNFHTWRALVIAAVCVGAVASLIGVVGAVYVPQRRQVKVASGAVFVVSGLLLLVPMAWTSHYTSQPLEGAVELKRAWGPALYLGWIGFALTVVGGGVLMSRCPTTGGQRSEERTGYPLSAPDVQHPLSTIERTAFTHSQYRRAQPI